jgi:hypothetical protein
MMTMTSWSSAPLGLACRSLGGAGSRRPGPRRCVKGSQLQAMAAQRSRQAPKDGERIILLSVSAEIRPALIRRGPFTSQEGLTHDDSDQGAKAQGMQRFRVMLQRGLSEAVAPNTSMNKLNDPDFADAMNDVGGNSFEAFLTQMIELIAQQAAADGKINPAYTQLAAAQATSMGGVQRSSYVSPAAGSTPTGRTEAAPRAALA